MTSQEGLFEASPRAVCGRDHGEGFWMTIEGQKDKVLESTVDNQKSPHTKECAEPEIYSCVGPAAVKSGNDAGDVPQSCDTVSNLFNDIVHEFKLLMVQSCQESRSPPMMMKPPNQPCRARDDAPRLIHSAGGIQYAQWKKRDPIRPVCHPLTAKSSGMCAHSTSL